MKKNTEKLTSIPTNIITGFLGAGKTSAILQLLNTKPTDERWAVLVNEFGEIGVDGSLFRGQHSEKQQVYIREVPGGCMCCTAGLPMQIALNQLLTRARPHRLLIEPTGLGHPLEVLEALTADYYKEILSIEKILTLVDARSLDDPRYTEHPIFNQQIAIADIIIGNKQDLYQPSHNIKLQNYAKAKSSIEVDVIFTQQGKIAVDLLDGATGISVESHKHHHQVNNTNISLEDEPLPASGFIKAVNKGEGFNSIGWRFDPTKVFNRKKLFDFLTGIIAERMKAVFITESGIYGYNLTKDALSEIELDDCMESRIEIIADEISELWEEQLLNCIEDSD
jgi:G3E family GTPase